MTEPRYQELFDGIAGLRASLKARAPHLRTIAARLREVGLDYEADLLDDHASEMLDGVDAVARRADGLLDQTQTMDVGDFAVETHADDE